MSDQIEEPPYLPFESIDFSRIQGVFRNLILFDDMFLNMQAMNIAMVDHFITEGEYALRDKLIELERTPTDHALFISAQSQMWIFALYELLRTWRQRINNLQKWRDNGGIDQMIKNMSGEEVNLGVLMKTKHLEIARDEPKFLETAACHLELLGPLFAELEAIRINLAKHEIRGKKNSTVSAPGYGRINYMCGSLDYELELGDNSYRVINRRDIADMLRAIMI